MSHEIDEVELKALVTSNWVSWECPNV
jgi:hypothetical protein